MDEGSRCFQAREHDALQECLGRTMYVVSATGVRAALPAAAAPIHVTTLPRRQEMCSWLRENYCSSFFPSGSQELGHCCCSTTHHGWRHVLVVEPSPLVARPASPLPLLVSETKFAGETHEESKNFRQRLVEAVSQCESGDWRHKFEHTLLSTPMLHAFFVEAEHKRGKTRNFRTCIGPGSDGPTRLECG